MKRKKSSETLWTLGIGIPLIFSLLCILILESEFTEPTIQERQHQEQDAVGVGGVGMDRKHKMIEKRKKARKKNKKRKGICESWPFHPGSMPLGATVSNMLDGCNTPCKGLVTLLWNTFALSFDNNKNIQPQLSTYKLPKENTYIDCADFAPSSTMLFMKRMNDKHNPYNILRKCMSMGTFGSKSSESKGPMPFITFRSTPKESKQGCSSELSTKAGLAQHVQRYLPCTEEDNNHNFHESSCIMPQTFSISENRNDCHRFFNMLHQTTNTTNNALWVKKPLKGRGGMGIERLFNPKEELKLYSQQCSTSTSSLLPPIVIQQYIKPMLILDGRSFHIRVYFLYKYPSFQTTKPQINNIYNNNTIKMIDPAQAWHIHVGNIHICSEPYSNINDPILGSFAVKCNGLAWNDNPRIQRDYGTVEEYMKQSNHTFLERYPKFLYQILSSSSSSSSSSSDYNKLMHRIDIVLGKVAQVISQKANETNTYGLKNEALWTVLGIDLLIDEHLRPWLIETNACPGDPLFYEQDTYEQNRLDKTRNPYIGILRIVMTHYKRHLMKNKKYDETNCGARGANDDDDDDDDHNNEENDLAPFVSQVM